MSLSLLELLDIGYISNVIDWKKFRIFYQFLMYQLIMFVEKRDSCNLKYLQEIFFIYKLNIGY